MRGRGQGVRGKRGSVACDKGQVAESGSQAQRQCHMVDIARLEAKPTPYLTNLFSLSMAGLPTARIAP